MKNMKGTKRVIASSLVIASLLMPATTFADTYRTTHNLNLRTGPSTGHSRILTIPKDANVTFHGKQGSWFNVSYNNRKGFVSSDFIRIIKDSQSGGSGTSTGSKSYTTTHNLNLRTGPSTSNGIVVTIPRGSKVSYLSQSGNWFRVSFNGRTGYVSRDYLKAAGTSTPSQPEPNPDTSGSKSYTTTHNLNLRTGPSTSNGIVVTIPRGSKVSYLSQSGNWFRVSFNGRTGYVSRDYLKAAGTSTPTQPEPKPDTSGSKSYTTTHNLNLRTGPSTRDRIVVTIPRGRQVSYISSSNGWYRVKYGNHTGYVSAQYIKVTEIAPKPEEPKPEEPKPEEPKPEEPKPEEPKPEEPKPEEPKPEEPKPEEPRPEEPKPEEPGVEEPEVGEPEVEEPEVEEPEVEEPEVEEPEVEEPEVEEPEVEEPEVEEPEVEEPEVEVTKPVIKVNTQGYVTTANLRLRNGIGTSNSILATIPQGTKVNVYRYERGWYQVRYGGRTGYVSGDYIRKPNVTRQDVVDAGLALVGRVPYFWGGKSSTVGWNNLWNTPRKVTAAGSSTTGKYLPFGLDCSGFIDWAFRTAGVGHIFSTGGTFYQWQATYAINKADLRPGDLAFKQSPYTSGVNHVGIYVGKNAKGENLFVHSAYSQNGVVVTSETEYREFKEWRRPYINY